MTDTQESVVINQNTNGQIFGFLRRLVNSCIASEWSFNKTIAAVVVVGAALYHYYAIQSLEARFETTVEKMLDKREQGSKTFIKEAIKEFETTLLKRLLVGKNCAKLYQSGETSSGIYKINPDNALPDFKVFCDQKNAGGGWTVVQRRLDGSLGFDRNWSDYRNGFGNLDGEFWFGMEKIHRLTKSPSKLRVDLEDIDGNTAYAEYDMFAVATESEKYQLSVGKYSGTAGDSLTQHHGYPFSTKNWCHDNIIACAELLKRGFLFADYSFLNLNGVYHHGKDSATFGVFWYHWKGHHRSVKRAEMKIRPLDF